MSEGQQSFFRSPWLWGGCGCCAGCLLIPMVIAALAGGGVFWAVRQSGIQEEVIERVRSDARVVERLGEPITTGWMVEGSINLTPGGGEADYSVPITGPKASGRVHVVAERVDGVWRYLELYVAVDGDRIDLTEPATAPAVPEAGGAVEGAASGEVVAAVDGVPRFAMAA